MEIKVITIIEIMFFIALVYTYFKVSITGKVTTFSKWIIALCSMGILFFADKIKLLLFVIAIAVIWIIRHKKRNNDELA